MGLNAIVLGKDSSTAQVDNIQSTLHALHVTSPFDLNLIGNTQYGPKNRSRGFVFGRRNIVNNTLTTLWTGPTDIYVFPTVAQQMHIVSSSASDTALGTGARTVHIHYLDNNWIEKEEIITLNGTTPVATTATNIYRVNYMHVQTKGSSLTSVGNISLTNTAGTVTYSYMEAGTNSARQAVYTVPAGVTGYITHWQASSGSTGNHFCQTRLAATTHDGIVLPDIMLVQDEQGTQNGGICINFDTPIPIPAKTDVSLFAISDSPNANVIAMGSIMGYFETII